MDLIAIAPVILRKPGRLTVKKGDASHGVSLVQGDVLFQSRKNASASVGPARALHGMAHFQITLRCQVGCEVEKGRPPRRSARRRSSLQCFRRFRDRVHDLSDVLPLPYFGNGRVGRNRGRSLCADPFHFEKGVLGGQQEAVKKLPVGFFH